MGSSKHLITIVDSDGVSADEACGVSLQLPFRLDYQAEEAGAGRKNKGEVRQVIEEFCSENGWEILNHADHVHLFLSVPPNFSLHIIQRRIKARSARILRQEFPELLKLPSMWTRSYFVSTAGDFSSETIKKYVERQL